jgi:hypothetical protein
MVRGYDTIFENKMLGMILIAVLIMLFVAFLVRGGLHAKRIMESDSAARKKYREEHAAKDEEKSE